MRWREGRSGETGSSKRRRVQGLQPLGRESITVERGVYRVIWDVVYDGDGDGEKVLSSTSATQSHHFNFGPHGEIWCVSGVILISPMCGYLPVSLNTQYT